MKTIQRLALFTVITASLGATAMAQSGGPGRNFGPPGERGRGGFTNRPPAITAAVIAANYASVAVYDANKDGTLDTTEQAAVAQALVDGKLQPPGPPRGPGGENRPAITSEMAQHGATRTAAMYAAVAPYDTDKNGQLSDAEQANVTAALANGTLNLPMQRGPGGGMRGGPRGGPGAFPPPSDQ